MPIDDLSDVTAELSLMRKMIERLSPTTGDSAHPGSGIRSVQIGSTANAEGDDAVAFGSGANAWEDEAIAIGGGNAYYDSIAIQGYAGPASAIAIKGQAIAEYAISIGSSALAEHEASVALGKMAITTDTYQVMLGSDVHTVVVPGTLSTPSARRLKQNITPAPPLVTVFPVLCEWEYITDPGRRRVGPIADDLVGTDAERYVTYGDDGEVSGIDTLGLLIAQNAALHARVSELETIVKGGPHGAD